MTLACRELRLQCAAYADDELGVDGVLEVERHLDECAACRRLVGRQRHLSRALRELYPREEAPEGLEARVRFADAQLEEMRATEQLALGGVGTEVEIAHSEVADWKKRAEAYGKAVSAAKRWLILVSQGIDIGTRENKDLVEPAKSYALNKVSQLNALYEYNLAMSRLAKERRSRSLVTSIPPSQNL